MKQGFDPPSEAAPQQRAADKFARYALLAIVLAAGAVFFNMIKLFLVPVILAAVTVGLFSPLLCLAAPDNPRAKIPQRLCLLRDALVGDFASLFHGGQSGNTGGCSPVSERWTTGQGAFGGKHDGSAAVIFPAPETTPG